MENIVVNGRFATRLHSGVDRVGSQLTAVLASLLGNREVEIITPRGDALVQYNIPQISGKLRGHAWEQFELPLRAGNRFLLNFCNTAPLLKKNQIVMIHDAQVFLEPESYSWAFRNWYKFLLPIVARRSRSVITISEYSKLNLQKLLKIPAEKIDIVHNGCDHILDIIADTSVYEKFSLIPGGYFLAIGSISKHKNIDLLLRAIKAFSSDAPVLVVAGGGGEGVFASAGLHLPCNAKALGRVTDGELRALYEGAVALLFPSLNEGFGLPPLEAMACGCPVIASTAGAIPEVCGEAAILIPPTDERSWVLAMSDVVASSDLRSRLVAAGYERAKLFTWRKAGEKLLDALERRGGSLRVK